MNIYSGFTIPAFGRHVTILLTSIAGAKTDVSVWPTSDGKYKLLNTVGFINIMSLMSVTAVLPDFG
jgi:hypothetical protein